MVCVGWMLLLRGLGVEMIVVVLLWCFMFFFFFVECEVVCCCFIVVFFFWYVEWFGWCFWDDVVVCLFCFGCFCGGEIRYGNSGMLWEYEEMIWMLKDDDDVDEKEILCV